MKPGLPRYLETRPGEVPDGYFLDGARITPITRIVEAEEALPPAIRRLIPAAVDQTIAAESAVEALMAAVENGISRVLPEIALRIVPDDRRRTSQSQQPRNSPTRLAVAEHFSIPQASLRSRWGRPAVGPRHSLAGRPNEPSQTSSGDSASSA